MGGGCRIIWVLLFFALTCAASVSASQNCNEWVAKGDGILVTPQDVDELASFYEIHGITSDMQNYTQAAIKFKLYSFEADRLGLDADGGDAPVSAAGVGSLTERAEQYLRWVMAEQNVSDLVIKSYFRSFPERFTRTDGEAGVLTEEIRKDIHKRITNAQVKEIDRRTYQELKARYNVQLCGGSSQGSGI